MVLLSSSAPAQFIESKLKDPYQGNDVDGLGKSIAIDGDTLIAGAPYTNFPNLSYAGLARVYRNDGFGNWTAEQDLTAPDADQGDKFGHSVGVSGDTVVVGAPFDDDNGDDSGSAYVFTLSDGTWSLQQKIVAPDAAAFDCFGYSVAISGETLVVAAPGSSDLPITSGSAYVFTRTGTRWVFQAKLVASDADVGDSFGHSVAIDQDTVAVGSPFHNGEGGNESGSVYVFTHVNGMWTEQATLSPSDAGEGDQFGWSVAISGNTVVGGAYCDDDGGTDASYNSGSAYVFTQSNGKWTQQAKLNAPDPVDHGFFGCAVAISGNTALIGAWNDRAGKDHAGDAYIFTRANNLWDLQTTLTGSSYDPIGALFGNSLAIDEDTLAVQFPVTRNSLKGTVLVFSTSLNRWSLDAILTVSQSAAFDSFGASVAIDGGTAVVGVPGNDDRGGEAGAAYVFEHAGAGWQREANLIPIGIDGGATFGDSVAVSGDRVVVGATGDNSAFVFTRSGGNWSGQAKLTASDTAAQDSFGRSVAIDGDTVIVGAPSQDNTMGAAYVFVRAKGVWTQQAQLVAPDREAGDYFGRSVGISGDTTIVGAWGDYNHSYKTGSAYVFVRSGTVWTQQARLFPTYARWAVYFGYAVAISGDTAVVGAYNDDNDQGVYDCGSVYVFARTNGIWAQQQKIAASDPKDGDHFGEAVALSGDTLVAGARYKRDGDSQPGAAYLFTRSAGVWSQHAKLTASDAADGDQFGSSVAISGNTTVIGAPSKSDWQLDSGSAYVFTRSLPRGWMMY